MEMKIYHSSGDMEAVTIQPYDDNLLAHHMIWSYVIADENDRNDIVKMKCGDNITFLKDGKIFLRGFGKEVRSQNEKIIGLIQECLKNGILLSQSPDLRFDKWRVIKNEI
jgi:hypothetical protein